VDTTQPDESRELRYAVAPITKVEVRDPSGTGDNTWTMTGYAAVFDSKTTLYDGKFLKLTESIAPSAFDHVLRNQPMDQPGGVVHFNFGHDMNRAVAATNVPAGEPGSLELSTDSTGLRFRAKVPRDDPDGVAMASKMRTGVLGQASFAFTIDPEDGDDLDTITNEDGTETEHRTLTNLNHLYDVCATPQGAYSQTVAQLRSLAVAIGRPDERAAIIVGSASAEGDIGVGTASAVGIVESRRPAEVIDLRVRSARRRFSQPME
jgi:HK97 family phage prohead protease